jgi:hypothetical protein
MPSEGARRLPIEKRRWLLSIGVNHGDAPLGNRAAFMGFVKRLRTPPIYGAVRDARAADRDRPLSAVL